MVTFVLTTYALVTFVHISNSTFTGPILTQFFWTKFFKTTFVLATFVHIRNISALTDPIFTKL